MRAGRNANTIEIAFFTIDNGFSVLQGYGAHGARLDAEAGTVAKFLIDDDFHAYSPGYAKKGASILKDPAKMVNGLRKSSAPLRKSRFGR